MNVFIVVAHPSEDSFTHKLYKAFALGAEESGHTIVVSDLYEMRFNPVMSGYEYQRESTQNTLLPVKDDVLIEQEKIDSSDIIVFFYPVWWSDCPAILKGWFDRVFTCGYAYGYDEQGNRVRDMKPIERGLVICPAGHSNEKLEEDGLLESMKRVMVQDRFGPRFKKSEFVVMGWEDPIEKPKLVKKVYDLGKGLAL